jgi:hypothetical protein
MAFRLNAAMEANPYKPPSDTRDWRGFLARLFGIPRRPGKCAFCGELKRPLVEGLGTAEKGVLICRDCALLAIDLIDKELGEKTNKFAE